MTLPAIPVTDAQGAAKPAVVLVLAEPARLRLAEERSRVLSVRLASSYAEAVRQVDRAVGRQGAYLLNHFYEWR